jgi:hypothetical protein
MQFQFNTSNDITGDDDIRARIEVSVVTKLDRISNELTRVEIHLADANGPRGGTDKVATLEARPRGSDPITVTATAPTVDAAAADAASKLLTAFDRERGRRTTRKGH